MSQDGSGREAAVKPRQLAALVTAADGSPVHVELGALANRTRCDIAARKYPWSDLLLEGQIPALDIASFVVSIDRVDSGGEGHGNARTRGSGSYGGEAGVEGRGPGAGVIEGEVLGVNRGVSALQVTADVIGIPRETISGAHDEGGGGPVSDAQARSELLLALIVAAVGGNVVASAEKHLVRGDVEALETG